jgi:hypothetical protein
MAHFVHSCRIVEEFGDFPGRSRKIVAADGGAFF